jgi:hypothetical protein
MVIVACTKFETYLPIFNPRQLNEVEVRKKSIIEINNSFPVLENLKR